MSNRNEFVDDTGATTDSLTELTRGSAATVGGSRLDPYLDSYAARARGMAASEIRALFAVASRPEVTVGSQQALDLSLRVGWVLAPHAVRGKLILAAEAAVLCPPAFSQVLVSTYLATEPWREQIKGFQEMYRERRDAMLSALDDYFPASAQWTRPEGGFYVWVTLPAGLNTKARLPRAVTARVAYVPGTGFYADGFGTSSMRLSYATVSRAAAGAVPRPRRPRRTGVARRAAWVAARRKTRAGRFGSRFLRCPHGGEIAARDGDLLRVRRHRARRTVRRWD